MLCCAGVTSPVLGCFPCLYCLHGRSIESYSTEHRKTHQFVPNLSCLSSYGLGVLLWLVPQAHPCKSLKLVGYGVQVKWRAELRERELERMSGLEGEWRRREAARTAEVSKMKAHYAHLDTQTRQVGCASLIGPSHCREKLSKSKLYFLTMLSSNVHVWQIRSAVKGEAAAVQVHAVPYDCTL